MVSKIVVCTATTAALLSIVAGEMRPQSYQQAQVESSLEGLDVGYDLASPAVVP